MADPSGSCRAIGCAGARGRWMGWRSCRDRYPSSRRGSLMTRPAPAGCSEAMAGRVPLPGLRARRGLGAGPRAADAPVRGLRAPGLGHRRHGAARQPPAAAHLVLAAWLVATHRNGMSARQLWLQLGLGSYKSAWLLLRKLRRAMVDPEREPSPAWSRSTRPPALSRRGRAGPARAVARRQAARRRRGRDQGRGPGRIRLAVIGDCSAVALGAFVAASPAAPW